MGKKKQKLQQAKRVLEELQKVSNDSRPVAKQDKVPVLGDAPISDSQLQTTIYTLKTLGRRLDVFRSPQFKELRRQLHPLIVEQTRRDGNAGGAGNEAANQRSLNSRISGALMDGRLDDSLQLLADFKKSEQKMKLGTVQRWVRDINVNTLKPEPQKVRLLDLVLRCTEEFKHFGLVEDEAGRGQIFDRGEWEPTPKQSVEAKDPIQFDESAFRLVKYEKAAERQPQNYYDLSIYTDIHHFDFSASSAAVQRVAVPDIPGAFVLTNVLSPEDCWQMRSMAERMGFELDVPVGGETDQRAQGCVWVASESLHDKIFTRCKDQLPQSIDEQAVAGINRRFRIYKYNHGNVYRPHVDGAWPGSGVVDGEYQYNMFGDRLSRLTFILYLNEDFEGGATTFFSPSSGFGSLDTIGVRPRVGSVLCFPHGDTAGSLVHEGSATTSGTKYIVRTDVLYMTNK